MREDSIYLKRERKKKNLLHYASYSSFRNYIRSMLRKIDQNASISVFALDVIDSIVLDLFADLAAEARQFMIATQKRTLTAWDVQAAVLEKLRGELAKHAVCEGQRAITIFSDVTRKRDKY
ncbi:histone H2B.2 [Trichonephila inaurata madagascariensis]|uniref:Histone H2B.2 n=1 Tax=Trichonephila inaurata madagascariensis TaxID=2747483 RepID=A0A8X6WWS0_9ARAC|nr:histone H2B.2 [Trichonephila inaurata madagascariensis]